MGVISHYLNKLKKYEVIIYAGPDYREGRLYHNKQCFYPHIDSGYAS